MALHPTSTMTTRMDKRMVGSHTPIHWPQQKRQQCQPTPTRGSSGIELQQSGTPNSRIRTGPSRTRMVLLDNIPRKNNLILQIVAGYCPCNTENSHLSVLQQHWQYQDQTQLDNTEHPHSTFWTNLRPLFQDWTTQGDQIILSIDTNEDIQNPEITAFFAEFGMSEAILTTHGQEAPPIQNHGRNPIDRIFTT